ncbi:C40 family peptidase [Ligilactobacillus cholophilus]|uniref:C40 family peptidase n=1 Tax=Ligilactobacillus cholophilus TaxID=3050131 RepID=UPI0025B10399|nr:C40 family peptidase [Ligilactobacillus cholophilus]
MKNTAKKVVAGTLGAAGLFLASTAAANADTVHHVAKNDTVWALSNKYGVSIKSIEQLNNIDPNTNMIYVGQDLKISNNDSKASNNNNKDTHSYVVKSGDSLWAIARQYNTTVDHLRELNGLSSSTIYVGQSLKLDGQAVAKTTTTKTTTTTQKASSSVASNASSQQATVKNSSAVSSSSVSQAPVASSSSASSVVSSSSSSEASSVASSSVASSSSSVASSSSSEVSSSQQAVIAANHTTYTVQSGDSLYTIAQAYGVSVESLREANPSVSTALIAGQKLIINNPTKDPVAEASSKAAAAESSRQASIASSQAAESSRQASIASSQAQASSIAAAQQAQQTQQASSTQQTTNNNTSNNTATSQSTTQQASSASTSKTGNGSTVVEFAQSLIGTPYVYGGTTPNGFDCSGFVQYVYSHFGVSLPRTTTQQENCGTQISVSEAQPGDLYFWGSKGSTYHVAIAIGNGQYIAAPEPGQSVSVGSIKYFQPSFAVRL